MLASAVAVLNVWYAGLAKISFRANSCDGAVSVLLALSYFVGGFEFVDDRRGLNQPDPVNNEERYHTELGFSMHIHSCNSRDARVLALLRSKVLWCSGSVANLYRRETQFCRCFWRRQDVKPIHGKPPGSVLVECYRHLCVHKWDGTILRPACLPACKQCLRPKRQK